MKFTILKENLAKGLNFVEKICGRNLVLPILNNVLLSTEKSFLKLTTTNLEIAITFWCLAKIEKEGEITVPVKVLSNFVALLENQKLNVELKNKILHIEGENYKTQLKGIDSKDFPIIPKIEKNEWIELNAFPFCEGISQVIDFSSPTQTRPELSGVYLRLLKDQEKLSPQIVLDWLKKLFTLKNLRI
jgi:DNA polymerase-3 subunit beta